MKRVAITGSSGAFGSQLISTLRNLHSDVEILGLDIISPKKSLESSPHRFEKVDLREYQKLVGILEEFSPDTIIHLAFVVQEMVKNLFQIEILLA
jgi:UDP-glucose 4-epimerase